MTTVKTIRPEAHAQYEKALDQLKKGVSDPTKGVRLRTAMAEVVEFERSLKPLGISDITAFRDATPDERAAMLAKAEAQRSASEMMTVVQARRGSGLGY